MDTPPRSPRLFGVGFGLDGGVTFSGTEHRPTLSVLPLELRAHIPESTTATPFSIDIQLDLADTLFFAATSQTFLFNVATYAHVRLPVSRSVEVAMAPGLRHTVSRSDQITSIGHEILLRLGADISNASRTFELGVYARPQLGLAASWPADATQRPSSTGGITLEVTLVWNQIGLAPPDPHASPR